MRDALAQCPHRPPCPGCPRYGERGVAEAALAPLHALAERAGLPPPRVVQGAPLGFRHRARLSIRGRAENPKLGIFELGTHRVVHIPNCGVHHPLINDAARATRRVLAAHRMPPYSDLPHAGRARALQVVVERASKRAQLVLVTNDATPDGLEPLFQSLAEAIGGALHSAWWNGNPERTNTLLGSAWHRFAGPDSVVETLGGVRVHYPPGAFGQNNLPLAERLGARVAELVPASARVLELYAGSGALGLPLAARSASLTLNEVAEHSIWGLRLGIAELPPEVRARVRIDAGPAEAAAASIAEADVVIADPPRKGLDRAVLEELCRTPPARFVFVSCGLGAFLTQTAALLESGHFALTTLEVYALFPFTDHVETLAVFDRRGP